MSVGRLILTIALFLSTSAQAQERATVQERFATKESSIYGHATVSSHVRNDFYDSIGAGVDLGFWGTENIGGELRLHYFNTTLGAEAQRIQETTGLTPDARPQDMMVSAGARWSLGYGKFHIWERWVVHFDPQLVGHAGVTFAETRLLPTLSLGFSFLTHWRWNIQAKLDLQITVQSEERAARGQVTSLGFLPMLGVGWAWEGL
jgi:outer membrane beta-barrel protein